MHTGLRVGAVAARLAHNQEVVGSIPTPATFCDGGGVWGTAASDASIALAALSVEVGSIPARHI